MSEIPIPSDPLKVALASPGNRARRHHCSGLRFLGLWVNVVVVCNLVEENFEAIATMLGVQPITISTSRSKTSRWKPL